MGREFMIELPAAFPHQREILLSPARFKAMAGGRRVGKTATGLMATIRGHGPARGTFRGAMDGGKIWWVAPTYPVANEIIWPDLKRALRDGWTVKSEAEHYIELPGGGSISVKSADNPDSLRGAGLDGVVMDEAAFAKKIVWTDVLRPALSDREGWALFLTTPNGLNWFYDLFKAAGTEDGWARWQLPTRMNPIISEAEIAKALHDIGPRAFAQEYLAEFTSIEGAEFDGGYFGDSIWFDDWPEESQVRWRVMALDPSKGKNRKADYSAFVMLSLCCDGLMFVDADLDRRDWRQIKRDAISLARQFKPHAMCCETTQFQEMLADEIKDDLRRHGVQEFFGFANAKESKHIRIRRLTSPLSDGLFRFKAGSAGAKILVEQLQAFPLASVNDDGPDSLEMAHRCVGELLRHGPSGVEESQYERVYA